MNIEKQLITKSYYQSFVDENLEGHPIEQLGELFFKEQKKERPDASYIRYAQGEVYFLNKDYEAAIFKWENVQNEFEQWARKNIADAYLEMELFQNAEEIYLAIQTESLVLQMEILLQLFSLYLQQNNDNKADQIIKQAVNLDPDYPNVTKLARSFFEQREDWPSALNLAIEESVRTKDTKWLEILKNYIRSGYAKGFEPTYFFQALSVSQELDLDLFEQLIVSLWEKYEDENQLYDWLLQINSYLKEKEFSSDYDWNELSNLYKKTYDTLMGGAFSMEKLKVVMPNFLHVWIRVIGKEDEVFPSSAVFAWNEIIPELLENDVLLWAEKKLFQAEFELDILEKSKELNEAILKWTEDHQLRKNVRLQLLSNEVIDFNRQFIGIVGMYSSTKAAFVNHFINDQVLENGNTKVSSIIQNGREFIVTEYNNEKSNVLSYEDIYREKINGNEVTETSVINVRLPNQILEQNKFSIVNIPDLSFIPALTNELIDTLRITDTILFILDEISGLTEVEFRWAQLIQQELPNVKMYFIVLNDRKNQENYTDIYYKLNKAIEHDELTGTVFDYEQKDELRQKLAQRLRTEWQKYKNKTHRIANYLYMNKRLLDDLFEQRTRIEKQLDKTIQWNEDFVSRMTGAIHQLEDMESEKIAMIRKSFVLIKDETKKEIVKAIPEVLKEMANEVTKDRDFRKIHVELNDEMNRRIQQYLNDIILPNFLSRVKDWFAISKDELKNAESFLEEIKEGFNSMLQEDRLQLQCDFKIFEDWQRDIDRLTIKVNYQPVNIFNRATVSQILLKGTGKVLSRFTNSKESLVNRYKQFIESQDYQEIAETIADQFLNPFTLLEQGLDRDIRIFFKEAFEEMRLIVAEVDKDTVEKQQQLANLRENPEAFRDPLKIFDITRLQYKYILEVEEMSYVNVSQ